jgi:carbonic anhydrase/acetyltransferase-like protein (isoleucine patch superfamily)
MTIMPYQQYSPSLAADVYIAPGARVVGRVIVGTGSSIWFNAVVRGDMDEIVIGAETNIQDNVTVHVDFGEPVRIGSRVTVGHNAVLHGCTVEDEALVGMGAIILNGAVVGRGSIIAAGSVVAPGTIIPPHSLVMGIPGKVVRELNDNQLPAVDGMYRHYAGLSRDYSKRPPE